MNAARQRIIPQTCGLLAICAALVISGCGGRRTPSEEALAVLALTTKAGIVDYAVDPDQLKHAAADYFATLAEAALTVDDPTLHILVGEAAYAESAVHRSLSVRARRDIERHQAALNLAMKSSHRTRVALSASDVFRVLIDDIVTDDAIPAGVMQLEHAGLRMRANLAATPVRWAGIASDQERAKAAREGFFPDMNDPKLKAQIATSSHALDGAIGRHDSAAAQAAAAAQRDQVKQLKAYFKRPQ